MFTSDDQQPETQQEPQEAAPVEGGAQEGLAAGLQPADECAGAGFQAAMAGLSPLDLSLLGGLEAAPYAALPGGTLNLM